VAKESVTQKIIEALLEGGEHVEEPVEKVLVYFPDWDYAKMRSYVYRILARIRRQSEKRFKKYEVVKGMFKIVEKPDPDTLVESSR